MTQLLPSTVPGKVVKISYYKNMRGVNTITAMEGTDDGKFFTHAPFSGDRTHVVKFDRNTRKNREQAYAVMLEDLEGLGIVEKGHKICTD